MNRKKSGFFPVKVRTYIITYPRNSGYNTSRKYVKDIGYKNDIAILYQRIGFENLCMFQYLFRGANIVTDE